MMTRCPKKLTSDMGELMGTTESQGEKCPARPEVSIVIPVYNSEGCLRELFRRIEDAVHMAHEVIFVNDHSTDCSWQEICRIASSNENVIGLNLRKNFGQDNAIMAGMNHVRGDYIVIMDDDLQHAPEDIPRLYERCREGYDACFANFIVKKQRLWKNLGSWLNGKVAEWMLGKPKAIYLSPFKVIRRDIVNEIISFKGPYPYVDGLLLSYSDKFTQIDVEHSERYAGRSTYSLMKSIAVWGRHFTGFSVLPLRVATFVGLTSAIAGLILSLYYIMDYFFSEHIIEGWTTLVVLFLFLGGLTLMALGIIGEYIGRSYLILNQKPQYSIESAANLQVKEVSN